MSDDENSMDFDEAEALAKLRQRKGKPGVHYGSIEESERARLEKMKKQQQRGDVNPPGEDMEDDGGEDSSDDEDDGNEMVTPFTKDEYMQLEQAESDERKSMLEEFERRKRARQIHVSTDDAEVRVQLRALGEPMTFFGEGPADRRNRLKDYLSRVGGIEALKKIRGMTAADAEAEKRREAALDHKVTWYHEGPEELKEARIFIANYSLPRARDRLKAAREYQGLPETVKQARKQEIQKNLRNYTIQASQIGDTRPVSYCCVSPDSSLLATASWRGLCKLWSMPSCEPVMTMRGHECNACCVVFHPKATVGQDPSSVNLASSATDGSVKLWSLESEEPLADVEGHPSKVSRVAFHPSGRFLATCVADRSWRLWDMERMVEILHQEGHSDAVYDICFQSDGAIAVTGGLDSYARAWDLRTGQCVMLLSGHIKPILGVDVNPNGYHVATGSQDNTIKIWDLRRRQEIYAIPAHTNLVSKVKFHPGHGKYLISSSYDNTAKVWSHPLWQPLKTLSGHDNKVMGVDIAGNDQFVVTCSFDRTYKLWGLDGAF